MADTLKQSLIDAHNAIAEKGGAVESTGAKFLAAQIATIPTGQTGASGTFTVYCRKPSGSAAYKGVFLRVSEDASEPMDAYDFCYLPTRFATFDEQGHLVADSGVDPDDPTLGVDIDWGDEESGWFRMPLFKVRLQKIKNGVSTWDDAWLCLSKELDGDTPCLILSKGFGKQSEPFPFDSTADYYQAWKMPSVVVADCELFNNESAGPLQAELFGCGGSSRITAGESNECNVYGLSSHATTAQHYVAIDNSKWNYVINTLISSVHVHWSSKAWFIPEDTGEITLWLGDISDHRQFSDTFQQLELDDRAEVYDD